MLKERTFWWSVTGFFVVCILGTVNHYLYEWCENNSIIGAFVPVNESVWEHLKLLFFPFMLFVIVEFIVYGRHIKGFLFSDFIGVMYGLIFIPVAFYAYSSIIGKSVVFVDVLIFIVSVAISFYIRYKRIKNENDNKYYLNIPAVILFLGVAALMIGLTYFPPSTAIFQSPQ
ncbi:MAG: DUF6512 family protein [Acutalibacteraceae bacterium]